MLCQQYLSNEAFPEPTSAHSRPASKFPWTPLGGNQAFHEIRGIARADETFFSQPWKDGRSGHFMPNPCRRRYRNEFRGSGELTANRTQGHSKPLRADMRGCFHCMVNAVRVQAEKLAAVRDVGELASRRPVKQATRAGSVHRSAS